jgi:beta-aspartyl-dipeptidase (metallo-type)
MHLGQMLDGGITTVVGCLGTDGLTRNVESVLMKAKGLRSEGVSAWILTGSYQVPTPTLLGDVGRDIALVEEVIGVGEVAIADHRSSGPTVDELIRLAEHARVGGMLAGKAGIVNLHMGDARDPFRLLHQVVERSELNYTQFLPTHCNRNDYIFRDAQEYGKRSWVDLTASAYPYFPDYEIKPSRAIAELLRAGVPLEHITLSSDGCGSLPDFDERGNLVRLATGQPRSIMTELFDTVRQEGLPLERALKLVTSNVADVYKLRRKGRVAAGMDADVVLLDADDQIRHVVARGSLMVRDGAKLRKGTFEP